MRSFGAVEGKMPGNRIKPLIELKIGRKIYIGALDVSQGMTQGLQFLQTKEDTAVLNGFETIPTFREPCSFNHLAEAAMSATAPGQSRPSIRC